MKLTPTQLASLKRMQRYRNGPPGLAERMRLIAGALFALLVPVSILAYLAWRLMPATVLLFIGLYLGAAARSVAQQRQFIRWWPLTRDITDWAAVEEKIKLAENQPVATTSPSRPKTRWAFAIGLGSMIFVAMFVTMIGTKGILGYIYSPIRHNPPNKVIVLSASWCGYCMSLRHHLTEMNIPYTDLDVEQTTEGRWAYASVGGRGIPVTIVGNQVIRGVGRPDDRWTDLDLALTKAGYEIPPKKVISRETSNTPGQPASADWELLALTFSQALVSHRYVDAYAMTSASFRAAHSVEWLQRTMEALFRQSPTSFGPCTVESSGPSPNPSDVGSVYVDIGGSNHEALFAFVTREQGALKIRDLDIGRP